MVREEEETRVSLLWAQALSWPGWGGLGQWVLGALTSQSGGACLDLVVMGRGGGTGECLWGEDYVL